MYCACGDNAIASNKLVFYLEPLIHLKMKTQEQHSVDVGVEEIRCLLSMNIFGGAWLFPQEMYWLKNDDVDGRYCHYFQGDNGNVHGKYHHTC